MKEDLDAHVHQQVSHQSKRIHHLQTDNTVNEVAMRLNIDKDGLINPKRTYQKDIDLQIDN